MVSVVGKRLSDFPEIAAQLDAERNGDVTAAEIVAGSQKKYWWRCDKGPDHVWEASPSNRTRSGHGCPCCLGRQVSVTNSLAALYPAVAAQLDPERNGSVTASQIPAGSHIKYWWRCTKGPDHVWEAVVGSRTQRGSGCPFCAGRRASVTNSLAVLYPEIAAQLDVERNGGIAAEQIPAGSGTKYWWRCDKGPDHVWKTSVDERTSRASGCPCCIGHRASITNSLIALYPEVASQLDPVLNGGVVVAEIVAGSNKKYWWRCDKGPDHVWEESVTDRTKSGHSCPSCPGRQVSTITRMPSLASYPDIASQLDEELNGGVSDLPE